MSEPAPKPARLSLDALVAGIRAGDKTILARAISLVESTKPGDRARARKLLQTILPEAGKAIRVGITGAPGVGKSTTIEALGTNLTGRGHKVAVLAVDPSSTKTGGSILGDKTRMGKLATDDNAYIRPSPASGTLGGVAANTQEAMALCEAAGFDVVLVETVGIGQSETAVAYMVDFFLLLLLPGAGDELQGIKKGVLEVADMIAVNKADGDSEKQAEQTAGAYLAALNIMDHANADWRAPVLTYSGLFNKGVEMIWSEIERHHEIMAGSGALEDKRRGQRRRWMHRLLEDRLTRALRQNKKVKTRLAALETQVADGDITPLIAVEEIARLIDI